MTAAVAPVLEGLGDVREVYAAARAVYAPKVRAGALAWAETERVLSAEASAEAGRYSLARTPWWREVLEAFADEGTEEVVVAKSSQVGYTELLNTFVGWVMAEDPSSMLMIQPTVEMAEAWSKERLAPMLRDTPALRGILRADTRGMARSSDDTLRRKAFAGGWLAILGANSPASLASRPVRRVIGDELDRWPVSAGKEGSPLSLAAKRSITFWNRKKIAGGTPTDEGGSPTWELWESSDQRRWHVRCPQCRAEQPFRWRDADGAYHLVCDRDADGRLLPETAQYRCAERACLIEERHKAAMVAGGRWVAEIVREFEASRGAEALLRVFVNTIVGEPFAAASEKLDGHVLMHRAEPMAEVPPEVGLLTAGVDVQGDRLEYVVVGWGERERACVLHYGIVEGDPGQEATWDELTAELAELRSGLPIAAVAADTGYRPETVWTWAGRRLPFRAFPIKGVEGRGRLLMQKPGAVSRKAQRRPWIVGSDTVKDSRAARLRSAPAGPQGVRFADTLPPEFFDHLTAERLRTVYVGGRPMRRWELNHGRRNEGGDCFDYALAALHALGPRVITQLGDLASRRPPRGSDVPAPTPSGRTLLPARGRRVRSAGVVA